MHQYLRVARSDSTILGRPWQRLGCFQPNLASCRTLPNSRRSCSTKLGRLCRAPRIRRRSIAVNWFASQAICSLQRVVAYRCRHLPRIRRLASTQFSQHRATLGFAARPTPNASWLAWRRGEQQRMSKIVAALDVFSRDQTSGMNTTSHQVYNEVPTLW